MIPGLKRATWIQVSTDCGVKALPVVKRHRVSVWRRVVKQALQSIVIVGDFLIGWMIHVGLLELLLQDLVDGILPDLVIIWKGWLCLLCNRPNCFCRSVWLQHKFVKLSVTLR